MNCYRVFHLTLTMLLHYLVKLDILYNIVYQVLFTFCKLRAVFLVKYFKAVVNSNFAPMPPPGLTQRSITSTLILPHNRHEILII